MARRLSQRGYAEHRGCTHRAVQKALRDGRISAEPDGKIDPKKADAQWEANTDPGHRRGFNDADKNATPAPNGIDLKNPAQVYNFARAQKEAAHAAIAKIELQERQKRLVDVDQVKERWGKIVGAAKNRLLRIPSELRLRKGVPDDLVAIVETEILKALEQLASGRAHDD
jgi:hypothetical protein